MIKCYASLGHFSTVIISNETYWIYFNINSVSVNDKKIDKYLIHILLIFYKPTIINYYHHYCVNEIAFE